MVYFQCDLWYMKWQYVTESLQSFLWHVADKWFSPLTSHFFSSLFFCFSISAQLSPSGSLALSLCLSHASSFSFFTQKKPNCNNSGLQTTRGFQTTDLRAVRPLLRYKYLQLSHSAQRWGPRRHQKHSLDWAPHGLRMPLENKWKLALIWLFFFS